MTFSSRSTNDQFQQSLRRQAQRMVWPLPLPDDWLERVYAMRGPTMRGPTLYDAIIEMNLRYREEVYEDFYAAARVDAT